MAFYFMVFYFMAFYFLVIKKSSAPEAGLDGGANPGACDLVPVGRCQLPLIWALKFAAPSMFARLLPTIKH
jgi:hypothetical protein